MKHPVDRLLEGIANRGWQGRIVPIDHLVDLREAIRGRPESGLFDEALYQEQLSFFSFGRPPDLPEVRSIIVIAVPVPQVRIFFDRNGKRLAVIVPPTYVRYTATTARGRAALASWLAPEGYRVANSSLPL